MGPLQKLVVSAKTCPCMDCGEMFPYQVLDFDHKPGVEKLFSIGAAYSTYRRQVDKNGQRITRAALLVEIDKCDVVCMVCHARRTASSLWLVVDPLEEVFTQANAEVQAQFFQALRVLARVPGCRVLAALRADFYQDLMNSALWPVGAEERVDLGPLGADDLLQAVVKPAEACGVRVEPQLAERLVQQSDPRQPGMLPVLQETMRRLWDRRVHRLCLLCLREGDRRSAKLHLVTHEAILADFAVSVRRYPSLAG